MRGRAERFHDDSSESRPLTADRIQHLDLFRGADVERVLPLLITSEVRGLAAGEVLLEIGQPNRRLYALLDGELSVRLRHDESEQLIQIGSGESVGEITWIDGKTTSARVTAETESQVLVLEEGTTWSLAAEIHVVAYNLLHTMARRLRNMNALYEDTRLQAAHFRDRAWADAVTGLHSRQWLDEMLPRILERSRREGSPLSLLMLDLDGFKAFNDHHGHLAGDAALRRVSDSIRSALRPSDLAARLGGDELVVLLPGTPLGLAHRVAERLRLSIRAAGLRGPTEDLTVSIGMTPVRDDATTDSLLAAADEALYRAKDQGRDLVCV